MRFEARPRTHGLAARAGLVVLMGAIGATTFVSTAAAAGELETCRAEKRSCVLVTVPLDRTGTVPGSVRLRVERWRAKAPTQPPLFMLGGEPGQSATGTIDSSTIEWTLGRPGQRTRDVVVMDLRGTGRSGPLRCPGLDRAGLYGTTDAAAACAASLGPSRGFYTARDSAQDIEAVRRALGLERIALFGASYGAQVAFAYAQRHPDRVERLALDSAVLPGGSDPLYRSSFAAVPQLVRSECRRGMCRFASQTPTADVIRLAARLERRPLRGTLVDALGRRHSARVGPFALFRALGGGGPFDLPFGRELPGIVRNALRGDSAPLLRLQREARSIDARMPWPPAFRRVFSFAAYAASTCEESPLPWSRSAPLEERSRQAAAFVRALPPDAFAPFGRRTALASDVLELCRRWPNAAAPPDRPSALPAIPALVLAGRDDIRTPVSDAEAVAALIPGARLMRLHWTGHDVISSAGPGCGTEALRAFLAGSGERVVCNLAQKPRRAPDPPPLSLAEVSPEPGMRGRVGRTVMAVQLTLRDGADTLWDSPVATKGPFLRAGGLRGGSYALDLHSGRLTVRGASFVPGVRVSGWITSLLRGHDATRDGVLTIAGRTAAGGTLVMRDGLLRGELDGRTVETRLRGSIYSGRTIGLLRPRPSSVASGSATSSTSSRPAPLARLAHPR